jgi:hypothetical protein
MERGSADDVVEQASLHARGSRGEHAVAGVDTRAVTSGGGHSATAKGSRGRAKGASQRPATPASSDDRIDARNAAKIVMLGYPDQFNRVRWELEDAFELASGRAVPLPAELRVPLLTTSQERALARRSPAEAEAYRVRKAARIAYAGAHWMRVPAWGGVQPPGGEYRYSRARCERWAACMLGPAPIG